MDSEKEKALAAYAYFLILRKRKKVKKKRLWKKKYNCNHVLIKNNTPNRKERHLLQKQHIVRRRLAVTLRFLATGKLYKVYEYYQREYCFNYQIRLCVQTIYKRP